MTIGDMPNMINQESAWWENKVGSRPKPLYPWRTNDHNRGIYVCVCGLQTIPQFYLYPSLGLFEATNFNLAGRIGTEFQFQGVMALPFMDGVPSLRLFKYTPVQHFAGPKGTLKHNGKNIVTARTCSTQTFP